MAGSAELSVGRSILFSFVGVILLGSAGYLIFELGRYQADYSILDQRLERQAFQQRSRDQVAVAEELRRQVTVLQASKKIDRETYVQIERDLRQLQQRIQVQEEELAFYKSIISPEEGHSGLGVQTFELTAMELDHHYLLSLVLVQAISRDNRISGVVKLNIDGSWEGEVAVLLSDEVFLEPGSGSIPFDFLYFQGLQRELVLPAGFEPSQVNVEIWPREFEEQPILQSYAWLVGVGEKAPDYHSRGDER